MAILRKQYGDAFDALEIIQKQIVKANEEARDEDVDELEQVEGICGNIFLRIRLGKGGEHKSNW